MTKKNPKHKTVKRAQKKDAMHKTVKKPQKQKRSHYTKDCTKKNVDDYIDKRKSFRVDLKFDPAKARNDFIEIIKTFLALHPKCDEVEEAHRALRALEESGRRYGVDFLKAGFFVGPNVPHIFHQLLHGSESEKALLLSVISFWNFPPDTVDRAQGSLKVSESRASFSNRSINHLLKIIYSWYLWCLENKSGVQLTDAQKSAFFQCFMGIDRLPVYLPANIFEDRDEKASVNEYIKVRPAEMQVKEWRQVSKTLA